MGKLAVQIAEPLVRALKGPMEESCAGNVITKSGVYILLLNCASLHR